MVTTRKSKALKLKENLKESCLVNVNILQLTKT